MQYTGLARKYPVGRPLSAAERERELRQKERLEVEPAYQLSVIRLNSTYMELVDKFFAWKGFLTTFVLVSMAGTMWFVGGMLTPRLVTPGRMETDWPYMLVLMAMGAPLLAFLIWALRKESFAYTHYPIRLNRRTRMVHVFRTDGTVLSVPWDEVFFCIGQLPQNDWEIQGHVLDADGVTVRETFAFPMLAGSRKESELLKQFWEFVRRYMEEPDLRPIFEHARYVLPIADKRETFKLGWHRTHSMIGALPVLMQLGIFCVYIASFPGRWFAMRTSKLPVWPRQIDENCRTEPGDPYVRDVMSNPADLR